MKLDAGNGKTVGMPARLVNIRQKKGPSQSSVNRFRVICVNPLSLSR